MPSTGSPPKSPTSGEQFKRASGALGNIMSGRYTGPAIAVALAGGCGLLSGWLMPRGPLTTAEALATMAVSLFVDSLQTSPYGLLAFIVGRGFHALLGLTPMILGAALGAGLKRSGQHSPGRHSALWRGIRRTVAVAVGLALVALAAVIARPASTAPVAGPNFKPLAGGPGGSELGAMRNPLPALEEILLWPRLISAAQARPTRTLTQPPPLAWRDTSRTLLR